MSREELATPYSPLCVELSLLVASHSPREMGREESIGRLEGGGTAHDELFTPRDGELAASFFAVGWLEEQGMRRAGFIARRLAPALFDN